MKRLVCALAAALLAGCVGTTNLNEETYTRILRPLMSDVERAEFYSRPTWDERKVYLYDLGLIQKFESARPEIRGAIIDGRLIEGMSKDHVMMSWGAPAQRMNVPPNPNPEVARFEGEKERWLYSPVVTPRLDVRYLRAVEFTNGVALYIRDETK